MSNDELVNRTLFCGNISEDTTEELLYELFLQAGPLQMVKIATDKDGNRRNFAFITFNHEISVPYTIDLMNGIVLNNRALQLKYRRGSIHERNDILGLEEKADVKSQKYQNIFEKMILDEMEKLKKKTPAREKRHRDSQVHNIDVITHHPIDNFNNSVPFQQSMKPIPSFPHQIVQGSYYPRGMQMQQPYIPPMHLPNMYNYYDYDANNPSEYFNPSNHTPYGKEYERDRRPHTTSHEKSHSFSREKSSGRKHY